MKHTLDLKEVKCPMNLVKIKLELEKMKKNDVLTIYLTDPIAIRDIPKSMEIEGHKILESRKLEDDDNHILIVKKS